MALFQPRPPLVPRREGTTEPQPRAFTLRPFEAEGEASFGRGVVLREVGSNGPDQSLAELSWAEDGVQGVNVVGEGFHLTDLQHHAFDPGHPVRIVPSDDDTDPGGLEVRDIAGELHPGHIRPEDRAQVRDMLAEGETVVLVAWTWQAKEDGERRGLRLLFARAGAIAEDRYRYLHPPLPD